MKNFLIITFLSLQIIVFAQKPFHAAVKINPYTMLTGRYGANLEIPLSNDFSMTLEGRYLTKDWYYTGVDFENELRDAKGINAIAGLRYYLPVEKKYRLYVSAEYRYRKTRFDFFNRIRTFNECNVITGVQLLSKKTNFTIDFGIGSGLTNVKETFSSFFTPSSELNGVVRIDILLGYRF